jgi:hypothetical protein
MNKLVSSYEHQRIEDNSMRYFVENLHQYSYVDSINVINEYYPSYRMYDHILRTDLDVFLAQPFAVNIPKKGTLLIGQGGYSTSFNSARLKRIASNMNWTYSNLNNIGSTWFVQRFIYLDCHELPSSRYGSPVLAQRTANFTLHAMAYLSANEFTTPERLGKLGVQVNELVMFL